MRSLAPTRDRHTRRFFSRYLWILLLVVLLSIGAFAAYRIFSPLPYRRVLVITGDPVYVVSIDAKRGRVTGLELPRDTVIRGGLGYGKFSLGSIITLDAIDKKNSELIRTSVSLAVGVPVTDVITGARSLSEKKLSIALLRQIFSLPPQPSTMGWIDWLRLVRVVSRLGGDALRVIDLSSAITRATMPDGSQSFELDEMRVDVLLDNEFFDADIRQESTSVAVYNTTAVALVGSIIARELSNIGVKLIVVGNKSPSIPTCRILGTKDALKTKAALFIQLVYGCEKIVDENAGKDTGAAIVLELGVGEASHYK